MPRRVVPVMYAPVVRRMPPAPVMPLVPVMPVLPRPVPVLPPVYDVHHHPGPALLPSQQDIWMGQGPDPNALMARLAAGNPDLIDPRIDPYIYNRQLPVY